jgi:hypothetical protein
MKRRRKAEPDLNTKKRFNKRKKANAKSVSNKNTKKQRTNKFISCHEAVVFVSFCFQSKSAVVANLFV